MLEPHPFEHAARLIGDPELLLPVFLAGYERGLTHPKEWIERRMTVLSAYPEHHRATMACVHALARVDRIDPPFPENIAAYMNAMPEHDAMHNSWYFVSKAASQIVYGTQKTTPARLIVDAICGHANRSSRCIADIIHIELNAGNTLPEDLIRQMTLSDISLVVLRSFLRCCFSTSALRIPLCLRISQCEAMWRTWVTDESNVAILRELGVCFRESYGRRQQIIGAWKPDRTNVRAAMFALMLRVTGGGFYIGTAPPGTASALQNLKQWSIVPTPVQQAARGRIGVCTSCLKPLALRELPNRCFECGTKTIIFFPASTHALITPDTMVVKRCCIGDHSIASDELAGAQIGSGYAICAAHREKFPWIGSMACSAGVYISVAKTMQQWSAVIAKRMSCYAKRKPRPVK